MANNVTVRYGSKGAKQVTSELDGLRTRFEKLQKQGAKGLLIGAGAAATTRAFDLVGSAISGVTDTIGESIEAASDLNETMSKSSVVFGDSARDIDRWGNTTASALGISKQAAVEAASGFGLFFEGAGQAQDKAADMSTTMVQLASDLASFNNMDPTEVLDKLRSGLSGEAEPMRRLGVFLTEAKVKAKGLEMGLGDAHGELSEGDKILARYNIILGETSTAQGDFARTADEAANKQRTLNAELENRKALLGAKALPVEKAWLDIQLAGIDALDDQLTRAAALDEAKRRLLEGGAKEGLFGAIGGFGERAALADQIEREWKALEIAAAMSDDYGDGLAGVLARTKAATGPTGDLASQIAGLADDAADAEHEVDRLADTIADELFGRAINRGRLADLRQTHKELEKQREEVEKGTPKWKILTGEIAENEKALFELQLQMKEEEGPQAVLDWLRRQKARFGDARGEIQKLIDKYEELYGVQASVVRNLPGGRQNTSGGGKRHRASGGPVSANEAYIVGERGEEVFVPRSNGRIIPNGGSGTPAASWGGDLRVHVDFTGTPMTPGAAEAFVNQVGPHLARFLQRRGLLTGARVF